MNREENELIVVRNELRKLYFTIYVLPGIIVCLATVLTVLIKIYL